MAGIENLKNGLSVLIEFGIALEDSLADDKIKLFEAISLMAKLAGIGPIINKWEELKAEYDDIDEDELEELIDYFVDEFDLDNDETEVIIEKAFALLASLDDFIKSL